MNSIYLKINDLFWSLCLLGMVSVSAMDTPDDVSKEIESACSTLYFVETVSESERKYKTGYAILDALEWVKDPSKNKMSLYSGYLGEEAQAIVYRYRFLLESSPIDFLNYSETCFQKALELEHPYAAIALTHIYRTDETKPQLEKAIKKSLRLKVQNGIKNSIRSDLDVLINLQGKSTKEFGTIQFIEQFSPEYAIDFYATIASDLENQNSDAALKILQSLSSYPTGAYEFCQALFCRNEPENAVKELTKLFRTKQEYPLYLSDKIIELAKDKRDNTTIPLLLRRNIASLFVQEGKKYQPKGKNAQDERVIQRDLFRNILSYYRLLKESKSPNEDISNELSPLMGMMHTFSEGSGDSLFELAQLFEELTAENTRKTLENSDLSVGTLYLEAAQKGSQEALEKCVHLPQVLNIIGYHDVVRLLGANNNYEGIQELYIQTNNPVFCVIESLMKDTLSEQILVFKEYLPYLDLKILFTESEYTEKKSLYFAIRETASHYDEDKPFVHWLDKWQHDGIFFDNGAHVHDYLKTMHAGLKEMEDQLKALAFEKTKNLENLIAEDLFNLAQEYDLIFKALEGMKKADQSRIFKESFVLCLKESAKKGFFPANEQLTSL